MDEAKVIEAIQQFGTPVWQATQLKVKLRAASFCLSAAASGYFFIWCAFKWHRSWQQRILASTHCTSCENTDPTAVKMIFYIAMAAFTFATGMMFFEGLYRWLAVDYYAYRELLP